MIKRVACFTFLLLARTSLSLDFVFDVDGVIATIEGHGKTSPHDLLLEMGRGQRYKIYPAALEVIQSLSEIPGARISIISSGSSSRNIPLAKTLRLPNGKTIYDITEGRVFSGSDVARVGGKRIDILIPDSKPAESFLIDDSIRNATMRNGMPYNFIHVFDNREDGYRSLSRGTGLGFGRKKPLTAEQIEGAENAKNLDYKKGESRLIYIRGLIDRALEEAKQTGESLDEIIFRDQFEDRRKYKIYDDDSLYQRGLKKVRAITPQFAERLLAPSLDLNSGQPTIIKADPTLFKDDRPKYPRSISDELKPQLDRDDPLNQTSCFLGIAKRFTQSLKSLFFFRN